MNNASALNIVRIILPDIIVFILSIISLILCIKANNNDEEVAQEEKQQQQSSDGYLLQQQKNLKMKYQTKKFTNWLIKISFEILFLNLLAVAGGLWPSILSIPYFLLFFIIISYWSCMKRNVLPPFLSQKLDANTTFTVQQPPTVNNNGYNVFLENAVKIFLLIYLAAHIILMYIYQFRFFQSYIHDDSLTIRLLGLYSAIITSCDKPAQFTFQYSMKFQQIGYPFVLIFFYWVLKFEFAYINKLKNSTVSSQRGLNLKC